MVSLHENNFPSHSREPQDVGANFIALVENANDGMLVIVGGGIIAYVNKYAADIVGKTKETVIGKSIRDFLHPDEFEKVIDIFQRRIQDKSVPDRYRTIVKATHEYINVELTVAKTLWGGEPASFAIIRDIRNT